MPYRIDPAVLATLVEKVAGLPSDEFISRTTTLPADGYLDLIDPGPGRWVGSKA
jgi:sigma non-opioid intracellular receptor